MKDFSLLLYTLFLILLLSFVADISSRKLKTSNLDIEPTTETIYTKLTKHIKKYHLKKAQNKIQKEEKYINSAITSPEKLSTGPKRVALFGIHFEGNLGDLMETTPLILKLNEWGVEIDCYLSMFRQGGGIVNKKIKNGVARLCNNIYAEQIYRSEVSSRNYDTIIIAPGPTVNHFKYCFADNENPSRNISLVWFGVTVTKSDEVIFIKQQSCLSLIALREPVSVGLVDTWKKDLAAATSASSSSSPSSSTTRKNHDQRRLENNELISVLSGDISFSYTPKYTVIEHYRKLYEKLLHPLISSSLLSIKRNLWVLVFSRSNNFGPDKGVWISSGLLHVRTMDGTAQNYDLKNVVFASSSDLEDHEHMNTLEKDFSVAHDRVNTYHSIEEMFALISLAPRVITDRYHPGVASLIQGKKLTVTKYPAEEIKLKGLIMMNNYTKLEIEKMNDVAFSHLLNIINSDDK